MALMKWIALAFGALIFTVTGAEGKKCRLHPLGAGMDDTDQVEAAINACGHSGTTIFEKGMFNITRRMMWDLDNAHVDLKGTLSFQPDIDHWLNKSNTFQVVFIQSQSSWFVVTGKDFVVDGHGAGGINGNGQPWWNLFTTTLPRLDGDGRPIAFTLWRVSNAVIRGFNIQSPPFWAHTVAESTDVLYKNIVVNATNSDPTFSGQNIVWNTDGRASELLHSYTNIECTNVLGINTFRSSRITMLNWDVTGGDDCIAIKGNSTSITARNFVCRGGEGIAFGSLGQYANLTDLVADILVENVQVLRLPSDVQPNNVHGIYFKSWDGSLNNGEPPTGGGGGSGLVNNAVFRNFKLDRVDTAVQIIQDFGGGGAIGSRVKFQDMRFENIGGTTNDSTIINLACSQAVGCSDLVFKEFDVRNPEGTEEYICKNAHNISGLEADCH